MVTLDDVRKGVMAKIASFKAVDTPIYGEGVPQNFKEPCFYVKVLRTSQVPELTPRYQRRHLLDIHYFPRPGGNFNEQALEMAETLYSEMEQILVNERQVRGVDMHHEVIDGVLHFFVTYPLNVRRVVIPDPPMEQLYQKRGLKIELKGED